MKRFAWMVAVLLLAPASAAHAQADTTAPIATIRAGLSPIGYAIIDFDEDVGPVAPGSVTWSMLDANGAAQLVSAAMRCKDASGVFVGCATTTVRRISLKPDAPHPIGARMRVRVGDGATPIMDNAGNGVAITDLEHAVTPRQQELGPAVRADWVRYTTESATSGSFRVEATDGAIAIHRFSGDRVTWTTRTGPNDGVAAVVVDGNFLRLIDNSARATTFRVHRTFYNLGAGAHTLVIRVRGSVGRDGAGAAVVVDGFRSGGAVFDDAVAAFRWSSRAWRHASSGRLARSVMRRATIRVPFWGGGIDWWAGRGPSEGLAEVLVDGRRIAIVDNSSSKASVTRRRVTKLADGPHMLAIRVVGRSGSLGTGVGVSLDRVSVRASVKMFKGLGAWIDLFDYTSSTSDSTIAGMLDKMVQYGVRTLYLETARYNSDGPFDYPGRVASWIRQAHARGLAVVGWYFPAYSEFLDVDVSRTIAVATYRTPQGELFDAVGIDIEYRSKTSGPDEFNAGIVEHLTRVRAAVGVTVPIASIAPPPNQMELAPSSWRDFPWSALGKDSDAVMPMAYSSYRKGNQCPTPPAAPTKYCTYRYTRDAVTRVRAAIANPFVVIHVIGGISNELTNAETRDFVRGAKDGAAFGSSLYDHRTTSTAQWEILAGR